MGIFDQAFSSKEKFFIGVPRMAQRSEIKASLHSPRGRTARKHFYSPGIGRGIGMLLSGKIQIKRNEESSLIYINYPTSTINEEYVIVIKNGIIRWHPSSLTSKYSHPSANAVLSLVTAIFSPSSFPETYSVLAGLASLVGGVMSESELVSLAKYSEIIVDAIHKVSDYLYYEFTNIYDSKSTLFSEVEINYSKPIIDVDYSEILGILGVKGGFNMNKIEAETPLNKLTRLSRRGGAAIMVGPPSTFKTTTARQVAVDLQCHIVEMRGSPGCDDRDLYGGYTRNSEGVMEYIDGPLPKVFALAQEKHTIGLVDEVLRFLPETINVFISVLNELTYEDCLLIIKPVLEASGVKESEVGDYINKYLPDKNERYYMLSLPTGQIMFALKKRITWIMTTNIGEDHIQVASHMDAALESRFEMIIEVNRADKAIVMPIYDKLAGEYAILARFADMIEDEMYLQLDDAEGLFKRALDPRKIFAFIKDAKMLKDDGYSIKDAVNAASESTLIPHVCPREANGMLNRASVMRIKTIISSTLSSLGA